MPLATRAEAIQYFIDHGNIHGTLEECLDSWPPTVTQMRNAADYAIRFNHRGRDEVERMTAALVLGK